MRFREIAMVAATIGLPASAMAQALEGPYISLSGGLNLVDSTKTLAAVTPEAPFPTLNAPNTYKNGFAVIGAAGYQFAFGLRAELEASFRDNNPDKFILTKDFAWGTANYTGAEKKYSLMTNVYYDLINRFGFTPYIGAGLGVTFFDWHGVTRTSIGNPFFAGNAVNPGQLSNISNTAHDTQLRFSYQLIGGVGYAIPGVPGLSLTAEYRFFGMPETTKINDTLVFAPTAAPAGGNGFAGTGQGYSKYSSEYNNSFLIGVRYAFGAAPAPTPAPAPAPADFVPAQASRSFIVFFDWDKAALTARAQQIIADAASASKKVATTRIEVSGYTDTSGTPRYNQGLSIRRAKAVAAELVRNGVAANDIAILGFGETHPLVPTAAGVREPQNRRVEILLK